MDGRMGCWIGEEVGDWEEENGENGAEGGERYHGERRREDTVHTEKTQTQRSNEATKKIKPKQNANFSLHSFG